MRRFISALIACPGILGSAFAGEPVPAAPPFCTPLAALTGRAQRCTGNDHYAEAAGLCVAKLHAAALKQQGMIAAAMARLGAASADAQAAQMQTMVADLKNMQATLDALIRSARAAQAEITAYGGNLVYPGPFPREKVIRQGLAGELSSLPCFARNANAIQAALDQVHRQLSQLLETKKNADDLDRRNAAHGTDMGSMAGNPAQPLSGRPPAALSAPRIAPGGRSARSQSRVTGVEKDMRGEKLPATGK